MNAMNYDVIIVGGGIHGAGVAQAVAAAGNSVLLVEKSEIGSGTSSKSSKLIHGGLRYLEGFQFSLVKSCLSERTILLRNAPDIVKLAPFYIPIYKSSKRRPWKIFLGLSLYNFLSGFKSPFKKIPKSEWSKLGSINVKNLQAVYQYFDAQTDDVVLTKAVVKSAQSLGADILTNAVMVSSEINKNEVHVSVEAGGTLKQYQCAVLVNAAGASVNEILKSCKPKQQRLPVDLVQGTHIVLNAPAKEGVYYLESMSDHRAVFAIPWKGKTLVGTTETKIDNSEAQSPIPHQSEIDYLLTVYNEYFPGEGKTLDDVIESFAGLRVLPKEEGAIFSRNRDTVLLTDSRDNPRVLSIYGGKLTAYRATAEKVLAAISMSLPLPAKDKMTSMTTKDLPLN